MNEAQKMQKLIDLERQIIVTEQKANASLDDKGLSVHSWKDHEIETLCDLYCEYKEMADSLKKKAEDFKELIFSLREPGTAVGPYILQMSQYTQITLPRKDIMLKLGEKAYNARFAQYEKHTEILRKTIKVQK